MAILGSTKSIASTLVTVYTCPAATNAAMTIHLYNRTGASLVRLALSNSDTPLDENYLIYDFPMGVDTVLDFSGVVLAEGERVVLYADQSDNVLCNIWGIEEAV